LKSIDSDIVHYVGIAADEPKRIRDLNYPLVEWGWKEDKCLQYCYDKGFDWGGLYKVFPRVSCWCCPLKSLPELRNLRRSFPELWAKLLDWEHKTWRNFRADYSVDDLERRFAAEDCQIDLFREGGNY
jgi:3'-phosphoadenosine 5'-phosphosulfate sulfotransferase (PAPS reductase)/FAD synthetase